MRVYLGIDWSQSKHDLCWLNETGAVVAELTIPHQPDGFEQLDAVRRKMGLAAGECWVGLETAHNLAIDFLWPAAITRFLSFLLTRRQFARSGYHLMQLGLGHDLTHIVRGGTKRPLAPVAEVLQLRPELRGAA